MAAWVDDGSVSSRVFDYTMLFDDITSAILMKLDSSRRCDVVDELIDELDMSMLMETRLKVFRYAKKKLLKSVSEPGNADLDPGFNGLEDVDSSGDAERIIGQWGMIARKGKPRVALDAIELLAYVSGQDPYFPHRILKKRAQKCPGKTPKVAETKTKQAVLPFKPVQNDDGSSEDDESESDVSGSDSEIVTPGNTGECRPESQDMFISGSQSGNPSKIAQLSQESNAETEPQPMQENHEIDPSGVVEEGTSGVGTEGLTPPEQPIEVPNDNTPLNGEDIVCSEMYEIPEDNTSQPSTNTPSMGADSGAISRAVIYAKLCKLVPLIIDVPPSVPDPSLVSKASITAGLGISDIVTTDVPPDPDWGKSIPQTSLLTSNPVLKPSPTMATQTEWDVWGMPISSGQSLTARPSACRCDDMARKFSDWKGEMERELAARDNQYRSKLNFLREEKLKADAERERMRSHIATLSTKVADMSALMAETMTRNQREGIPTRPKPRGAVAFQDADIIEECPLSPQRNKRPLNTNDSYVQQKTSAVQRQGTASRAAPGTSSGSAQQPTGGKPQRQQNEGVERAIVHHEPDPAPRTRDIGAQSDMHQSKNVRASSGMTQTPSVNRSSVNAKSKQGRVTDTPLPQRVNQPKQKGRGVDINSCGRPQNTPSSGVEKRSIGSQSVSYISWHDDPVSDVEMISMANATTPGERQSKPMATPTARSSNPSRSDILREALVEIQLKELRNKQQNEGVDKGEKRRADTSSGNDSATYAEATGKEPWITPEYNKKKKNKKAKVDEPVMELLGAKDSPNKDLFVIMLDYSRCKRPDQLENMVKHYCRRRGVEVLYAKAFVIQSDRNRANCKVSVNEADVPTLLADGFWPDPSYARYWYSNPSNQQGRNDRSSEDESLSD